MGDELVTGASQLQDRLRPRPRAVDRTHDAVRHHRSGECTHCVFSLRLEMSVDVDLLVR